MSTQLVETNHQQISAARIALAKAIWHEIVAAEGVLFRTRNQIMNLAHRLGGELCAFKEEIGHGRWTLWLTNNFQELGRAETTIIINAQRCMALYQRNPTKKLRPEFTDESERKFFWYYNKAKERSALEGDEKDQPQQHYLTFVNNFAKWDRQVTIGQSPLPPIETLRHELENTQRRIIEICGADWVASLLPRVPDRLQIVNDTMAV